MNDIDLGYKSTAPDYDQLRAEIDDKTAELYKKGISADVDMGPLITLKCYAGSEEGVQEVYDAISKPDDNSGFAYHLLDAMLACYAGRLDGISRPGLIKSVTELSEPITYCSIQMQPLVRGPAVMGLDEIFGEDVVEKLLSDFKCIPMDKPYVCCCHQHGKAGGSNIFLMGDRIKIENIIPEIYEISQNASLEDICPYQTNCAFKKAYKANGSPSIRLINDPFENALLVFQNRINSKHGPNAYTQVSAVAEKILKFTSDMVNGVEAKPVEPMGYR